MTLGVYAIIGDATRILKPAGNFYTDWSAAASPERENGGLNPIFSSQWTPQLFFYLLSLPLGTEKWD
jgi:hypothetical protein